MSKFNGTKLPATSQETNASNRTSLEGTDGSRRQIYGLSSDGSKLVSVPRYRHRNRPASSPGNIEGTVAVVEPILEPELVKKEELLEQCKVLRVLIEYFNQAEAQMSVLLANLTTRMEAVEEQMNSVQLDNLNAQEKLCSRGYGR